MQRTISSKLTLLTKFFTPIWLVIFVVMFGRPFFDSGFVFEPPHIFFALLFIGIGIFAFWYHLRLKKVTLLSDSLLVSNHFKQIIIPFSEISHVTENVWNNIHPVTIHIKNPTEFGSKIVFMPTVRHFTFWSSHPIVKELKQLSAKHGYYPHLKQ